MKNIILLILAIILFAIISLPGFLYTAFYYLFSEKDKGYKYTYRCAFAIDVLANCLFGEVFEMYFSSSRGKTYFGTITSISAALGHLIVEKKISRFGAWFSGILDIAFHETHHCINAYNSEILKQNSPVPAH